MTGETSEFEIENLAFFKALIFEASGSSDLDLAGEAGGVD